MFFMSTVIFAHGGDANEQCIWASNWAACDSRRVVVNSRQIASLLNDRFDENVRPLAVACAVNVLINAAKTGRDVVVLEDLDSVERRLRYIAKRQKMVIVEHEINGIND